MTEVAYGGRAYECRESETVLEAQVHLLTRRRELFGRLLAMKFLWMPTPKFKHFSLFRDWIRLPFMTRVRSFGGTLRRLVSRGLWRPRALDKAFHDAERAVEHPKAGVTDERL